MEQNTQPGQTQQAPPQMFQLIISGEEAGLMLNKLNAANFTGFKEASMATTIFAKIQSAQKMEAVPTPGAIAKPPASPQGIRTTPPGGFTPPPNVEGNGAEEDNRPVAPLKSINEAKEDNQNEDTSTAVPPPDQDSIFSVVDRSTKGGMNVGESDI